MGQPKRRAIVIIGMHRSGTSALAGAICLAGAKSPAHLIPPHEDINPSGFWESAPIVKFNDDLLASAGSSWHDTFIFGGALFDKEADPETLERAVQLLEDEYPTSIETIMLKDPRISVLTELWRRALELQGFAPIFFIMVRRPADVIKSLVARDNFSALKARLLWSSYMYAAEAGTRGCKRYFVSYEALTNDWQALFDRLEVRELGMELSMHAIEKINSFVRRPSSLIDEPSADEPDTALFRGMQKLSHWFIQAAEGNEPPWALLEEYRAEMHLAAGLSAPVNPLDIRNCYRFFLGRNPESEAILMLKSKMGKAQMLSSFVNSFEFGSEIYNKTIADPSRLSPGLLRLMTPELVAWAAEFLPIESPSRDALRAAVGWHAAYRIVFRDKLFLAMAVEANGTMPVRPFIDALEANEHRSDASGRPCGVLNDAVIAHQSSDNHYKAYVGPPSEYDLMGATQFRLLTTLGLRANHQILDFGCGSLRVGKLLIPYLDRGNYHGLEANAWLIEEAIEREIGRDLVAVKWPHFHIRSDFRCDGLSQAFDYILAQSILSHTGRDCFELVLKNFRAALRPTGISLVTVVLDDASDPKPVPPQGWVYPDVVRYQRAEVEEMFREADFACRMLPWFHPRQVWYALAIDPARLPSVEADQHLRGAVLNQESWAASVAGHDRADRT